MSNISGFSSRSACRGLALGLNAGLGNLGVSVMQVCLIPIGDLRGPHVWRGRGSGTASGGGRTVSKPPGTLVFLQNAGWVWVPFSDRYRSTAAAWGMNNLKTVTSSGIRRRERGRFPAILLLLAEGSGRRRRRRVPCWRLLKMEYVAGATPVTIRPDAVDDEVCCRLSRIKGQLGSGSSRSSRKSTIG
jgi:hypothetical protein